MKTHPLAEFGIESVEGPHTPTQTGGGVEVFAGKMVDQAAIIQGDLLDRIAQLFRDIYGHGKPIDKSSWGEYSRCTDIACERNVEPICIGEAAELEGYKFIGEVEADGPVLTPCPSCSSDTELFWEPLALAKRVRGYFETKNTPETQIFATFLADAKGGIHGFEYGWMDTVQNAWDETISHLFSGTRVTMEEYLRQMKKNSDGKLTPDAQVLHLVEVGQPLPSRGPDTFQAMIGGLLNSAVPTEIRDNVPSITTVGKGIATYFLTRAAEWVDACTQDDEAVKNVTLVGSAKAYGEQVDLPAGERNKLLRETMRSLRRRRG